jgi:hypothetical protein
MPANSDTSGGPVDDREEGIPHSEDHRQVEMMDVDRSKKYTLFKSLHNWMFHELHVD